MNHSNSKAVPFQANSGTRLQRGLTLVEIMVALTLGLILTAGVIQLFVSNKRAYEVQTRTVATR